ncbi:MAG: hypothetical protein II929_06030 [Succinivibrio sp.]|nr:hypothetical protein [Succinivibrio sp.]
MKRDWKVIKGILESAETGKDFDLSICKDYKLIAHNLNCLVDAGCIDENGRADESDCLELDKCAEAVGNSIITMKGHDLLDCLRYKKSSIVLDELNNMYLNGPLDLILDVVMELIKKELKARINKRV